MTSWTLYRLKSRHAADYLAIAVAISLPWSTSATSIFLTIFLIAFLPTFNLADLRKELFTPAGGLPVLLFVWAAFGMLWSDLIWKESFEGLRQFQKLVFIPVALAYFRHSDFGMRAVMCLIASCVALLVLSLITAQWPQIQWWPSWGPGVPVKNYVTQSVEFVISAFCLFYLSIDSWKGGRRRFSIACFIVGSTFLGFTLFIVGSRTEFVAIAALIVVFGVRLSGWKGLLLGMVAAGLVAIIVWNASSYVRTSAIKTISDMQTYRSDVEITSTGYRIEFWEKSITFIAAAPLIGHGTGSIKSLFERSAADKAGISAVITSNPHNQTFAVAIQLGLVGAAILCSMWIAHLLMFTGPGAINWFGLVFVVQNIVGSLFNTHLFDFTEGWIYVCCVGALGGAHLRSIQSDSAHKNLSPL